MRRMDATAWVVTVCAVSLRLSQAKTLAALVAAAMQVERVSLANIGRRMLGSAKHQIKRCWRFAYLLLCGIGLLARQTFKPSAWSSSSKDQSSLFQIGLLMMGKLNISPPQAFALIFELSENVAGKWG
jgi:hypothetical protein